MAFEEDLSPFFDVDGFGVPFTYIPEVGAPISAVGIFDDAFYAAQGGEVSVAGSQPQLQYPTASIPDEPIYGEGIQVNGKEYSITSIQPDGTGITTLMLEVQEDGSC